MSNNKTKRNKRLLNYIFAVMVFDTDAELNHVPNSLWFVGCDGKKCSYPTLHVSSKVGAGYNINVCGAANQYGMTNVEFKNLKYKIASNLNVKLDEQCSFHQCNIRKMFDNSKHKVFAVVSATDADNIRELYSKYVGRRKKQLKVVVLDSIAELNNYCEPLKNDTNEVLDSLHNNHDKHTAYTDMVKQSGKCMITTNNYIKRNKTRKFPHYYR